MSCRVGANTPARHLIGTQPEYELKNTRLRFHILFNGRYETIQTWVVAEDGKSADLLGSRTIIGAGDFLEKIGATPVRDLPPESDT